MILDVIILLIEIEIEACIHANNFVFIIWTLFIL